MNACSIDLQQRVIAACDRGDATREQVAERLSVSLAWVGDLLRRRDTGSIAPKPGGGRARAFDVEADDRLRAAVKADDAGWPRPPASSAPRRPCIGR